jgi:Calx-beta domain/FG-GAP-like repeat
MNRSRALLVLALVLAIAVGQLSSARPAAGTGGSFTDIGAGLPGVVFSSTAWGDYDSDGDLDVLLAGADGSNAVSKIYRNDGAGVFTEIAAGLAGVYRGSVAWGDYDSDGDLDILLTGHTGSTAVSKIYRNNNGTGSFTDIGAGLAGVAYSSVAWGDYDSDGDLDVLLTGALTDSTRISRIYRNDDGIFTDISAGLPGVSVGSVAWGDYDMDGDLDILLSGDTDSGSISRIYRNDDGIFTDIGAGLAGVGSGSAAWGDYDSDGDLDVLLSGGTGSGEVSKIYQNNGGNFSDIGAGLTGVDYSSAAWGDYDSDGDLDVLLSGESLHEGYVSKIYRNDGSGGFADSGAGLTGAANGSVDWGDYDSDGDLDILLAGWDAGLDPVASIYGNNSVNANVPPSAPSGLGSSFSGGAATLSWSAASDSKTPAAALTYNLRVGVTSGGSEVVSPMASSGGDRFLPQMGNAQERTTAILRDLPPGTYFWSVQAIDNNFAGSRFSAEETFVVPGLSFAFSSASYSVDEGAGSATITITRSGSTAGTNWVQFSTSNISATAGSDYTAVNGQPVSFSPGETSNTVSVQIADDHLIEGDETVSLTLFNPSSGTLGYLHEATLTIEDNEPFSDSGAALAGVEWGSAAWGDYDSDGDLDVLLSGCGDSSCSTRASKIYRNNGGVFVDSGATLTAVGNSSVAWGDYDSDGDLDVLLSGNDGSGRVSKIYKNNGGSFTPVAAGLTGVDSGSVAWGDYDSDGDLDILLSGDTGSGYVSKIYRNNGSDSFTDIGAGLTGVSGSSVAWGDYDSDGDLDILLAGALTGSTRTSKIYRNDDGVFTDIGAGLPGVVYGAVAWGDYDSDGDLDILLTGGTGGLASVSKIYRNDGGTFTENTAAGLTGVGSGSSAAWGDYDSDGDLDVLLSGFTGTGSVSKIYSNNGSGSFAAIEAGLPGVDASSVVWGDYDSDGDLDILLTGFSSSGDISKIFRNETSVANALPGAPSGLNSSVSSGATTLSWSAASDSKTPAAALTYNLRVGTTPGGSEIVSPMASSGGYRRLAQMGNAQEGTTAVLRNLRPGTYYWSLQAVDSSFAGSPFASERTFTVLPPTFAFSSVGYSVSEGDGHATITINRSGSTVGSASVRITTVNGTATTGSDYTDASQTVNFANGETSKTVSVPITDDSLVEGNETVSLSLSSPSADATLGSPSTAALTIVDDDRAFAFSSATYSIGEAGPTASITINRAGLTTGTDSVHFTTANGTATAGSDYTAVSQDVTFAADETTKTVTVPISDDSTVESSETVLLSLSSPSAGATLGSQSSATLTITDNDTAPPPTTKPATTTSKGKIVSCKLSKKSFPSSQAGKVKLTCKFSPKSKVLKYVLSLKNGKKWAVVKSVKKTGSFKKVTLTVKKLFAGKAVKSGQYRLKLSADKNSKTLRFKVT